MGGGGPVFRVTNTGMYGLDLIVTSGLHGETLQAIGIGEGVAVRAVGGDDPEFGGYGIVARGGSSTIGINGFPGDAILARGGNDAHGGGASGIWSVGGDSSSGIGGPGVIAIGGEGSGPGNRGGAGITAAGGPGVNGATGGLAGHFSGNVEVTGTISAPTKNFKIDHPLDPENKYLYHTSVESPDMMNIYNGNIITDENGEATVQLPEYFQALNRDFRYQLTVIGAFAQAIIADEITRNRFVIRTNDPNVKVSWQVT